MERNNFDNYKNNSYGCKQDRGKTATTRTLTKIIVVLQDINPIMNYTEIKRMIGGSARLKDALNWLVANKIICRNTNSFQKKDGTQFGSYYLNNRWVKLRHGISKIAQN